MAELPQDDMFQQWLNSRERSPYELEGIKKAVAKVYSGDKEFKEWLTPERENKEFVDSFGMSHISILKVHFRFKRYKMYND